MNEIGWLNFGSMVVLRSTFLADGKYVDISSSPHIIPTIQMKYWTNIFCKEKTHTGLVGIQTGINHRERKK